MTTKYKTHHILKVVLLAVALAILPAGDLWADEDSRYLDAVREFADNVLKYGRDTYGPKHTPLFVDGLNIHTHEPVKWKVDGQVWTLSNLASHQNLFRFFDGLTKITGDPKYREAAVEAIKYAFANLRSPNGLLCWGGHVTYDAQVDKVCGRWVDSPKLHEFKCHYSYYRLMWEVDPKATKQFVESLWSAHIVDWSCLDFDRHANMEQRLEEAWKHEYRGVGFLESTRLCNLATGSDMFYAAALISKWSGDRQPLVWAKRLARRFIETRHPNTGISLVYYNNPGIGRAGQLIDDFAEHFIDLRIGCFPPQPFMCSQHHWVGEPVVNPWICEFLLGEMLGKEGKEFIKWPLEELTAWGKVSYRKRDNSWIPMLTDGTSIEGYVCKRDGGFGVKGTVAKAYPAIPLHFWTYALAYRLTADGFMWEMVRNIAEGNNLGDLGITPEGEPSLNLRTEYSDPYALFGFLELHKKLENKEYLDMAMKIADNVLTERLHKGFFVPSRKHIYTRFDSIEPLALLHLCAAIQKAGPIIPQVWPSRSYFEARYRGQEALADIKYIYTLTKSLEPPETLHESAISGNVEKLESLISKGVDVKARDCWLRSALHCASMHGHERIVEVLLANGANVDEKGFGGTSALHYSARAGHKDIFELLVSKGADINAKNNNGQTPLDIALSRNRKDIVELLLAKGATISSIHIAAQMGVLAGVKALLEQGADVNAQDDKGITPLKYAALGGHKELVEFLIANGADINGKDKWGYTPLYYAIWNEDKDMVRLLVAKGADVNLKPEKDYPPLHYVVWNEDIDTVKLLVAKGAKFDFKDQDGWTAFRYAASQGNRDIVEFFVGKGADATTFHLAACIGDLARVKNFVEQGTDVDTKDEMDWTALYWAASTGREDVAEFLIAKGADVGAKAKDISTALHQTARAGGMKLVKLLILRGADVNAKDKRGNAALHSAASAGHRQVAELLIAKGAYVNAKTTNGWTPLHNAARQGHKGVVELLLSKGADADAKDNRGQTPLWWANRMGHKEIIELLRKHGAKE